MRVTKFILILILSATINACAYRCGLRTNLETYNIRSYCGKNIEWIWIQELKGTDRSCVAEYIWKDTSKFVFVNDSYRNSLLYTQASIDDTHVDIRQLNRQFPIQRYRSFNPVRNDLNFYKYDKNEHTVDSTAFRTDQIFEPYHTYIITFPGPVPDDIYLSTIYVITLDHDLSVFRWEQHKSLIKNKARGLRNL